ncbi:MAG: outer spore coat protein CotE [Firmicutes bacterium]|nr:outer spore coat protein CotE [Bacillota bacterium]
MFKKSKKLSPKTITHQFKGYETNGKIVIDGSYDVNIWYSYDNNSKTSVVTKKQEYSETVTVRKREDSSLSSNNSIIVRSLKQPTCSNVNINDGKIDYTIEKELGIEIMGETKMKIAIEEDEEPWDIIDDDEVDEEVIKEIDDNVEEKFI